jgi:hypothetical protein
MPAGTAEEKLPDFPILGGVIDELPARTKRQMLERLHMDYKYSPHRTSNSTAAGFGWAEHLSPRAREDGASAHEQHAAVAAGSKCAARLR